MPDWRDAASSAFTSANGVSTLAAKHIILATGARARPLPGLTPDGDSVWSYREALVPKRVPQHLVVIGAGAIGIEFASFYHALGAKVSVIEMADRVLPVEDEEVSQYVGDALRKQGMHLYTGSRILSSSKRRVVRPRSGRCNSMASTRIV